MLTEDVAPRGTREFYYSAQKAELEALLDEVVGGSATDAYVFRPCIVAGRDAPTLIEGFTGQTILGPRVRKLWRALDAAPLIGPVLPDTGTPFQLVHHDDVATAIRAAVIGQGRPGTFNLAGDPAITAGDVARALGWRAVPIPRAALGALAEAVSRAPFVPAQARWINAIRKPVLMDTGKARRELRWRPRHDARGTLRETVDGARAAGVV